MTKNTFKIFKLVVGLFLFAVGIVLTINANIGYAPWDILNQGLNNTFGITMGQSSKLLGLLIILIDVIFGQGIGWGTVANMFLIGTFMDVLMLNNIIPKFSGFIPSAMLLVLGVFVQGYAAWIYISAGFGAGPRDGLMVALTKKTGKSVRTVKSVIEILVVVLGVLLGGKFGIGTVLMALFGGIAYQLSFKSVNFNVKEVKHRYIIDDIKFIKEKLVTLREKTEES